MAGFGDVELSPSTLSGVLAGDRVAFEQVYRSLGSPVLGLATRILQDSGLAQEVVQDTFVDLLERGHQLREADSLVPWVRKVAINHCLMRLRSPWHSRRVMGLASVSEIGALEEAGASTAPQADLAETAPDIEKALAKLSPEARFVVWLHDVEGYTHQEIGGLLEKTASYSKSQLARGYEKLAKLYQGKRDAKQDTHSGSSSTPRR